MVVGGIGLFCCQVSGRAMRSILAGVFPLVSFLNFYADALLDLYCSIEFYITGFTMIDNCPKQKYDVTY